MKYTIATASHVGRVRTNNEDSVFPPTDEIASVPVIIAVADGMGGHAAGEIASQIAISAAVGVDDRSAAERVYDANESVLEESLADQTKAGMGTTLTLAIMHEDGRMEVAHVGDSRAYLYRGGRLTQLTKDHTLVRELVAQGHVQPEDAHKHPRRHVVTRTVGMNGVKVDSIDLHLQPGDRVLLCSDGLTNLVNDDRVVRILESAAVPTTAAWSLVEAANSAGGHDNTTVVVADIAG